MSARCTRADGYCPRACKPTGLLPAACTDNLNIRPSSASRASSAATSSARVTRGTAGWLQAFSGYGESLVDYNRRQNKVGLGVTTAGWR